MSKNTLKLCLAIAFILLIFWVGVTYREAINLDQLRTWVASYGAWAPLVFIVIYILATVLFLPGLAITLTGGFIFGPYQGTLYNLIGATIGSTLAFLIARYLASDWVAEKTGGRLKQLINGVAEAGWRFVAFMRLVPLFPFNLLNYAFGLTKVRLSHYVIASAICMAPATFAYTYVGSLGHDAIMGETRALVQKGFIAIGLLVLLAALPWFIKRYWMQSK